MKARLRHSQTGAGVPAGRAVSSSAERNRGERPSDKEIDFVILNQCYRLLAQLRLFLSKALARQLLNLTQPYTNVWVTAPIAKDLEFLFICLFVYLVLHHLSLPFRQGNQMAALKESQQQHFGEIKCVHLKINK